MGETDNPFAGLPVDAGNPPDADDQAPNPPDIEADPDGD